MLLITFFALVPIVCSLLLPIYAVVEKSSSFYVNDDANVLGTETEQKIIEYNGALERQCNGAQVVVVTVEYLDGMKSSEYAMQIFNDWGIGSSTYNNGVLILLATSENKYYVQYGRGLNESNFEEAITENIDTFESEFDAKMYDDAVNTLFDDIVQWFEEYYDSSLMQQKKTTSSSERLSTIIEFIGIICCIFWLVSVFGARGHHGSNNIFFLLLYSVEILHGITPPMAMITMITEDLAVSVEVLVAASTEAVSAEVQAAVEVASAEEALAAINLK